jgi:hypothetical protein
MFWCFSVLVHYVFDLVTTPQHAGTAKLYVTGAAFNVNLANAKKGSTCVQKIMASAFVGWGSAAIDPHRSGFEDGAVCQGTQRKYFST